MKVVSGKTVNSLFIKTPMGNVLFPQSAVAGIVRYTGVESCDSSAQHLRYIKWHDYHVPIFPFSIGNDEVDAIFTLTYIAIMYGIDTSKIQFYAIAFSSMPRTISVGEDNLIDLPGEKRFIKKYTRLGELDFLIPDLDSIEKYMSEHLALDMSGVYAGRRTVQ